MIRASKYRVLCLALFFGFAMSSSVEAEPALKDAQLPPDIREGQMVPLKLTFAWPANEGDYEIQAPQTIDLKNIALLNVSQSQESYSSASGQISQLVLIYQLLPLKAGRGMMNSFDVHYRKPKETSWKTVSVPPLLMDIKPALPLKLIMILGSVMAAIILPFALWFILTSWAKQKREKRFLTDPKQQLYANTIKTLRAFMSGYNESELRTILSEWSAKLTKVVQTYYDIPLRPATKSELLGELGARKIPDKELHEIEDLFNKLEHLRFSTKVFLTSNDLETLKLSLLPYIQKKIIVGEGLY